MMLNSAKKVFKKNKIVFLLYNFIKVSKAKNFPLSNIINKHFEPGYLSPHFEVVEFYYDNEDEFDIKNTRYWTRNDNGPYFYKIPEKLDCEPKWWVMPWAYLPDEEISDIDLYNLREKVIGKFLDLLANVKKNGFSFYKSGPLKGYLLIHPKYGERLIIVDGHHRLAILNFLNIRYNLFNDVKVEVLDKIYFDQLHTFPVTKDLINNGLMSINDASKWFENAFWNQNS